MFPWLYLALVMLCKILNGSLLLLFFIELRGCKFNFYSNWVNFDWHKLQARTWFIYVCVYIYFVFDMIFLNQINHPWPLNMFYNWVLNSIWSFGMEFNSYSFTSCHLVWIVQFFQEFFQWLQFNLKIFSI